MHKIGIFGAAAIAPRAIIEPARRRDDVVVAAIASRRGEAAAAYAGTHGIPTSYSSYDGLLDDKDVNIIYIAIPPSHHAEWAIKALEAGKHVLCEKPLAMNAQEARSMYAAADRAGRILAEAFHYRHHPLFPHLISLRESLGDITSLAAEFHVDIPWSATDIRYSPELGGGAMMDLGVYPLHWLRSFMGKEPEVLSASAEFQGHDVDTRIVASLSFGGGVKAQLVADIQDPPFRPWMRVEGINGVLEIDNPSSPHRGHSIRRWDNGILHQYTISGQTTYDYQLAAFLTSVNTGIPSVTDSKDGIANMVAVDQILAVARHSRAACVSSLKKLQ